MPSNDYVRIALVVVLALLLFYLVITFARGFVADADTSKPADACAKVVRIHRGLQSTTIVKSDTTRASEGAVEIAYRGTDGENLPVEGVAACNFAVGEGGALTLVTGEVDGTMLSEGEVRAIRGALDERP